MHAMTWIYHTNITVSESLMQKEHTKNSIYMTFWNRQNQSCGKNSQEWLLLQKGLNGKGREELSGSGNALLMGVWVIEVYALSKQMHIGDVYISH